MVSATISQGKKRIFSERFNPVPLYGPITDCCRTSMNRKMFSFLRQIFSVFHHSIVARRLSVVFNFSMRWLARMTGTSGF